MHHVTVDDWSRRDGFLQRRDARAKLLALSMMLVAISVRRVGAAQVAISILIALLVVGGLTELPLLALVRKSLIVLPFCIVFALFELVSGNSRGALDLVSRSYASGFASLLFMATTPWTSLIRGLQQLHVPQFLLGVMQFLYRYLLLLFEEARLAREAALSRGGFRGSRGFHAAAGVLGVMFARSYARANQIYQAMLCRGYSGTLPPVISPVLDYLDVLTVLTSAAILIAAWWGASL